MFKPMRFLTPILAFVLITAAIHTEAAAKIPNIVVILTDDQGYADVSYNPKHPEGVRTPNIDALAKGGGKTWNPDTPQLSKQERRKKKQNDRKKRRDKTPSGVKP